jgi:hypothetical protein
VVDVLHSVVGITSKGDIKMTLDINSHVLPSLRGYTASATDEVLKKEDDHPSG